jgi:Golgi transport complex subunit 5
MRGSLQARPSLGRTSLRRIRPTSCRCQMCTPASRDTMGPLHAYTQTCVHTGVHLEPSAQQRPDDPDHCVLCRAQDGLRLLEDQLRGEVLARHDELVGQAERLATAETAFSASSLGVGSLQAALRRVRAEILEPYQQVPAR